MKKIRVAINGYGNIGKRVAEAVQKQDDMVLVGVSKSNGDYHAHNAIRKGIKLYHVNGAEFFIEKGIPVAGSVNDMLKECDVVVDCAPSGVGKANAELYKKFPNVKVIYQGGEKDNLAEVSFNAHANYDIAKGKKALRVVSCNTTGLCRIISTLEKEYGVKKVRVGIVRRAADPNDPSKFTQNALSPNGGYPSHHAHDLNTVIPTRISSMACIAPTTLMHSHMLFVELKNPPSDAEHVLSTLKAHSRIITLSQKERLESTGQIKDFAYENGRQYGDVYEACVYSDAIGIDQDGDLGMHVAIDQQAIVIPENIDAIRAIMGTASKAESIRKTDASLGINGIAARAALPKMKAAKAKQK